MNGKIDKIDFNLTPKGINFWFVNNPLVDDPNYSISIESKEPEKRIFLIDLFKTLYYDCRQVQILGNDSYETTYIKYTNIPTKDFVKLENDFRNYFKIELRFYFGDLHAENSGTISIKNFYKMVEVI